MRIIDKLQDYYDYLADPTDTLVFDRRGSVLITKQDICNKCLWGNTNHAFLLFQNGVHYWLFLLTATKIEQDGYGFTHIRNYDMELLNSWVDYSNGWSLLSFWQIDFNSIWQYGIFEYSYKYRVSNRSLVVDKVREHAEDLKNAVIHKDFKYIHNVGQYEADKEGTPLLKACGIANFIDAETMYYTTDEYFAHMKSAMETTEAKGTTNEAKIRNHGFDVKTSFRGK